MTTITVLIAYVYFLGPWMIGPFTDMKSCQDAREYQVQWGVKDVTECRGVFIPKGGEHGQKMRGTIR